MAHDVFISYSTKDKMVADAVCATLERKKIRCWIAPRDVPAGQPFAASLVKAIKASSVIVLILSEGSNQSTHVLREVGEAVDNGIPILPLRIENVDPTEEMHYYIKSIHWLDAMNPPLERHLEKLADSVQALLTIKEQPPQTMHTTAIADPAKKPRAMPVWGIILLVFIGLAILGSLGAWMLKQQEQVPLALSTSIPSGNNVATAIPVLSPSPGDAQWRTLAFITPNDTLWRQTENSYTIIAKPSEKTIAWSEEMIAGDFSLSAEVTSEQPDGNAQFIIYGDGVGLSKGCLIFTYGPGFALITKDTIYHQGENWLVVTEGDFGFQKATHAFTIEITGGTANFYVDGLKAASAFLPSGTNRQGRVGLLQHWEEPVGVTYSNIKIKILGGVD